MNEEIIKAGTIFPNLIDFAAKSGISSKRQPGLIHEINIQAGYVALTLFNRLNAYYNAEGEDISIDAYLIWCAYAGIGGTYLWNDRWDEIRDQGVLQALLEHHEIYELDDYVTELVGYAESSEEADKLLQALKSLADHTFDNYFPDNIDTPDQILQQLLEMGKALFYFGVSYGLEMLGM